jgi:hypothetical protein
VWQKKREKKQGVGEPLLLVLSSRRIKSKMLKICGTCMKRHWNSSRSVRRSSVVPTASRTRWGIAATRSMWTPGTSSVVKTRPVVTTPPPLTLRMTRGLRTASASPVVSDFSSFENRSAQAASRR